MKYVYHVSHFHMSLAHWSSSSSQSIPDHNSALNWNDDYSFSAFTHYKLFTPYFTCIDPLYDHFSASFHINGSVFCLPTVTALTVLLTFYLSPLIFVFMLYLHFAYNQNNHSYFIKNS